MVWGNSQIMVPKEAQSGRVCDMMIIDGSRMPEEATADLLNLRELAVSTEGTANTATPHTGRAPVMSISSPPLALSPSFSLY